MSKKNEILKVSKSLFKDKGYAGASMREIAEASGIETASLYYHFSSKERILKEVCYEIADAFMLSLKELRAFDADNPVEKVLIKAISNHLDIVIANSDASAVFLNEWRMLSKSNKDSFKAARKKYESYFTHLIQQGVEQGVFKKNLNVEMATVTILSTLNSTYNWYKPSKSEDVNISKELKKILLNGIKK